MPKPALPAFPTPPHQPARPKNERLAFEILSVVEEIPAGRVATYGQIARLIGREKNARLVGSVLGRTDNSFTAAFLSKIARFCVGNARKVYNLAALSALNRTIFDKKAAVNELSVRPSECGILRPLSLPSGGECGGSFGAGLGGAGGFVARGGSGVERRDPCVSEALSLGLLIIRLKPISMIDAIFRVRENTGLGSHKYGPINSIQAA